MSTAGKPKSPDSDKTKRYDRQLRLWGDHGQALLENAHVCLINATATGTEVLKNLILPAGCVKIREKRPGLRKEKKNIFHQGNGPAHKSVLSVRKLRDLRYHLLGHPPYSPDFAHSDFHLFPDLKKLVSGERFTPNEEVERAVDEYFNSLPDSFPGRNSDIG
ncbi:NAE1 [Cordylochernes scorpioides]|uniref:NAE1 n=1 Tax=Cordylochernes scorpioides TaxID=51811 RepID=A0ABY6K6U3_9ARAC|nr:NAE1 [Cordylochernes scorpioides]